MRLVVISFAIKTRYYFYGSDFYRSDWSLRQFTSLMNCMLGSLALLSKLAIILTDLMFIGLIGLQDNLLYL